MVKLTPEQQQAKSEAWALAGSGPYDAVPAEWNGETAQCHRCEKWFCSATVPFSHYDQWRAGMSYGCRAALDAEPVFDFDPVSTD